MKESTIFFRLKRQRKYPQRKHVCQLSSASRSSFYRSVFCGVRKSHHRTFRHGQSCHWHMAVVHPATVYVARRTCRHGKSGYCYMYLRNWQSVGQRSRFELNEYFETNLGNFMLTMSVVVTSLAVTRCLTSFSYSYRFATCMSGFLLVPQCSAASETFKTSLLVN